MLFDGWQDLWRILAIGTLAYPGLIFLLRITGKRTLSKMNAFDLVITVAFGSSFATVLLNKDVSLAEGLVAFALLCGLQYVVASASVRSERFQGLIKAQPSLLFYRGGFLPRTMTRERVTREEVLAAVRAQGLPDLQGVQAVVLETDGSFSVVAGAGDESLGALTTVRRRGDTPDPEEG